MVRKKVFDKSSCIYKNKVPRSSNSINGILRHPVYRNFLTLQQLNRLYGNRHVQRLIQRENDREGSNRENLTEGVEVPGVAGSSEIGFIGDILSVLDTSLTITDIVGSATGAAFVETMSFSLVAGLVGTLGAILFMIGGLFMLAEANRSGEKWAAVQGASYAIVSIAHGRRPPPAPGWMRVGSSFNRAAEGVRTRISQVVNQGGRRARRMLGTLLALRRQEPSAALNSIYQSLVEKHLQETFLGFRVGGILYHMARDYRLTWPEVGGRTR